MDKRYRTQAQEFKLEALEGRISVEFTRPDKPAPV